MEDSSQDRNLPASERKIRKAREEGQIARSRDLTHLAVLGGGSAILGVFASGILDQLKGMITRQFRFDATMVRNPASLFEGLSDLIQAGLVAYLPLALCVSGAVILASIASGGWVVTLKPLMPDISRISPMGGFKRLFSTQQLTETAKLVAFMSIIAVLAWNFLSSRVDSLTAMLQQSLPVALAGLGSTLFGGAMVLTGVVFVAALLDLPLQSYLHGAKLRMSHQEMKQEHKESEGNPMVKGRQRAKQREMAQRSSVNAVPGADLVVMNPTHYAVALKYDEKTMRAPRVIAKGADLVAMRIRDLASSSAVPVLQAPMLARALYANAEIDQEVPAALYTAVAQVLAYVYQLKAAMRGEMPPPPQFSAPEVPPELDPHTKLAASNPS